MKGRKIRLQRRIISLVMVLVMAVTLLPEHAFAVKDDYKCRLVNTTISLSIFPVHYIVYEEGGKKFDSRTSSPSHNYAAWEKMTDAEKRKVTKWFAGFSGQLKEQFGEFGGRDMLNFANVQSGWKEAGATLRDRLGKKNYPQYHKFFGVPGDQAATPPDLEEFMEKVRTLSDTYSAEEKEDFDAMVNDYNVAYIEGFESYGKLLNLKQAQTNVAVTAISSELIQIIMDNMIVSKPLSLPSTAGDLKDAAINFVDKSLEISDTLKKSGLYKYSPWGVRDHLTGEDQRIDSKEAAQVVALYNKLLAAREDYVEAAYLTCTRMHKDLSEKLDVAISEDEQRANAAEEAIQKQMENHRKAVEKGVQYIAISPDINITRGEEESQESYDERCVSAAHSWAYQELLTAHSGLQQLIRENQKSIDNTLDAMNEAWQEAENTYNHNIAKYADYDNKVYPEILDLGKIFEYYDYAKSINARQKAQADTLSDLKKTKETIGAGVNTLQQLQTSLKTDAAPYLNRIYSLCYGISNYGEWGLGEDRWTQEWNSVEDDFTYGTHSALSRQDKMEGLLAQYEEEFANDREAVDTYNTGLQKIYDVYYQTQLDIDWGMTQAIRFTKLLRQKQEAYPSYLDANAMGYDDPYGDDALIPRKCVKLQDEYFGYMEAQNPAYEAKVSALASEVRGYIDEEEYYLDKIGEAVEVAEVAENQRIGRYDERKKIFTESLNENQMKNLNAMGFGGLKIKSYDDMAEEYGYSADDRISSGVDGEGSVKKTVVFRALYRELGDQNVYMHGMSEHYTELMQQRGDYLRAIQTGDEEGIKDYEDFKVQINADLTDAARYSFAPFAVERFFNANVKPILNQIDRVLGDTAQYVAVKDIIKESVRKKTLKKGMKMLSDEDEITMKSGEHLQLNVSVSPEDATFDEIIWGSSDIDVADVDGDGYVTAYAPGRAVITATAFDSPSDAPISVQYEVVVTADGNTSLSEVYTQMKDAGETFRLLSPSLDVREMAGDRSRVSFNGVLVYTGEKMLPPVKIICAIYAGDKYIGGSAVSEVLESGLSEGGSINLQAATDVTGMEGKLHAKVYMAGDGDMEPLADYDPLEVTGDARSEKKAAKADGTGIYGIVLNAGSEDGSAGSDEDSVDVAQEYYRQGVTDQVKVTPVDASGNEIQPVKKKIDGREVDDFYQGAEGIRVEYAGAATGCAYAISMTDVRDSFETGSIEYFSQETEKDGKVSFTVLPSGIGNGSHHIYLSGSGVGWTMRLATLSGYVPGEEEATDTAYPDRITFSDSTAVVGEEAHITGTMEFATGTEPDAEVAGKLLEGMTFTSSDTDIVKEADISVGKEIWADGGDVGFEITYRTSGEGKAAITGTLADGIQATCRVRSYLRVYNEEDPESPYDPDNPDYPYSRGEVPATVSPYPAETGMPEVTNTPEGTGRPITPGNMPGDDVATSTQGPGTNTSGAVTSNGSITTQTPKPGTTPKPLVEDIQSVGTSIKDSSGNVYKVTQSGTKGKVSYSKAKNKKVKSVTIPAVVTIDGIQYQVTGISANALKGNAKLRKVTIGKNVAAIGKKAFYGCKNLKQINIKSQKLTSASVGSQAFKGISKKATIKVPKKKKATYKKWLKKKGIAKTVKIK